MSKEDIVKWGKIETGIRYFSENTIKYDPEERKTVTIEIDRVLNLLKEAKKEFPTEKQAIETYRSYARPDLSPQPSEMLKHARDEWFLKWFGEKEDACN